MQQKPQTGCLEVGRTIDKACDFSSSRTVDIICGDLNMARWQYKDAADWHEGTYNELELRHFIPVADHIDECCFVAAHDQLVQTLHIKGSSWGEKVLTLDEDQRKAFLSAFLEKVGAKPTSHDVHWPMSLALRMRRSRQAAWERERAALAQDVRARGGRGSLHANALAKIRMWAPSVLDA